MKNNKSAAVIMLCSIVLFWTSFLFFGMFDNTPKVIFPPVCDVLGSMAAMGIFIMSFIGTIWSLEVLYGKS